MAAGDPADAGSLAEDSADPAARDAFRLREIDRALAVPAVNASGVGVIEGRPLEPAMASRLEAALSGHQGASRRA